MIIYKELESIGNMQGSAVALGNFDGVHLGHQKLIRKCIEFSKKNRLKSIVFTFSNHPRNLLSENHDTKFILTSEEKGEIIRDLGADFMVNIPFTREIMGLNPEEFIENLLIKKLNMKAAFCGFDYRFGAKAKGNPNLMRTLGAKDGFEVFEMEPFTIDNKIVSSTLIRNIISQGNMDKCLEFMGRNYYITGEVIRGEKLGRKLGFPTLNLNIEKDKLTPPPGVFVTYTNIDGKRYPSVTSVGYKPTVGNFDKNVETYIFDFHQEIYGKMIKVEFLTMTRKEEKFDTVEKLIKQIKTDCIEAKEFHKILVK